MRSKLGDEESEKDIATPKASVWSLRVADSAVFGQDYSSCSVFRSVNLDDNDVNYV